ncbi:hypothetical protein ACET3Z_011649 [Daucus carota]
MKRFSRRPKVVIFLIYAFVYHSVFNPDYVLIYLLFLCFLDGFWGFFNNLKLDSFPTLRGDCSGSKSKRRRPNVEQDKENIKPSGEGSPTPGLCLLYQTRVYGMFSGTQDKCATCIKTAYPLEKTGEEGDIVVSCRTAFGLKPIQESKEHIIFHCYVFTMLDVAFFHRD